MTLTRRTLLAVLLSGTAAPGFAALPATPSEIEVLTAGARAMFPHRTIPLGTYRRIVAKALTGASPAARNALSEAAAALAGPAAGLHDRIAAKFALPGLQSLRIATLLGLYGDPAVVRGFGYPGPSLEFGGYLEHGFGDLPWLPAPPPAWLP